MGQVKEKLNAVRNILHLLWHNIGMDAPENHEEIVQYVFEDVNECADPDEWHSGDVAIAFRRWIEAQASENVRDGATLIPVGNVRVECTNGMVDSKGKVIMYGDTIDNVQQLKHVLNDLDDHDQLTLVTCDEHGDEQDHYPMAIDVIGNIRLTDNTIVREVQFIQRPHEKSETEDYRIGLNFTKVYNELLKTNKRTHIAKGMGYSTTTQLENVLTGSACISTPAIMNLVKNYNVNPSFLYTGLGNLFN